MTRVVGWARRPHKTKPNQFGKSTIIGRAAKYKCLKMLIVVKGVVATRGFLLTNTYSRGIVAARGWFT